MKIKNTEWFGDPWPKINITFVYSAFPIFFHSNSMSIKVLVIKHPKQDHCGKDNLKWGPYYSSNLETST